jgi:hypothetical protein
VSDALEELQRLAASAPTFGERMRARSLLFRLGFGDDPWSDAALLRELDRSAESGVAAALADAGRALLAADRLSEVAAWLPRLSPQTPQDREALAVVQGLLAIRDGVNAEAVSLVARVPHPEAVALHGLALLQLGQATEAASRLEVLLAADALDEQGEVEATYLPESMPVLALFLTACTGACRAELRAGRKEKARAYAEAARDALRRYPEAEVEPGTHDEVRDLLERCAPA